MAPPRPRVPWVEVIFAVLLPVCTLSFGGFIYFIYAAIRHRKRRLYAAAAAYLLLFALAGFFMELDPTNPETQETSTAENIGIIIFVVNGILAAVHGVITALQSNTTTRDWVLREQARQFAAMDPAQAVYLGIGRPDLNRSYDDGGLIDVNNVPSAELARVARLTMPVAHQIVADRLQRGPFQQPVELLQRGLVSERTMRRIAPQLIALPPAAAPTATPWAPSGSPPR
jgi:DNA uptake protein ComE-like DNA-binding protein